MLGGGEDSGGAAMKKGPWTAAEDAILMEYVKKNGEGNWNAVQRNSGLSRCGKSCRLRWANHLRPNLKKGSFSPEEERLILELHAKLGNKWARMATQLPGRTDNEIKNYWNTRIKRRQRAGLPLYPPDIHHAGAGAGGFLQHHRHHYRQAETTKLAQFQTNPTPLSLFDPIPMVFSSEPPPPALMGRPMLGGSYPSLLSHSSARRQQRLKEESPAGGGLSTIFLAGPPATPIMSLQQQQQQQQQYSCLSVKMELPSSQFPPAASSGAGEDPWARNNSGLLDALLEDPHAGGRPAAANRRIGGCGLSMEALIPKSTSQEEATGDEGTEEMKLTSGESSGDGGSYGFITENKVKNERMEEGANGNEDLSALFDFMPLAPQISSNMETSNPTGNVWFKKESGETSNGQSSGVTEDDIGLEMHHLASSLSMADEDHTWNIGSDHWDNMPGIC